MTEPTQPKPDNEPKPPQPDRESAPLLPSYSSPSEPAPAPKPAPASQPTSEEFQQDMDDLRFGDLFTDTGELDDLAAERFTLETVPRPRLYALFPLMAAAILIWAAALIIFFLKRNPGLLLPFTYLFDFSDYHLGGLARFPLHELAFGLIGLLLMWAVGRFFLDGYESYLPRPAHHCLAFTLGLGISGAALTLLTIAHLHYQATVILVWVALIAGMWLRMVRMQRRWENPVEAKGELFNIEAEKGVRRGIARRQFAQSIHAPRGLFANVAVAAMMTLLILITLLTFWHALFYPETYWDSLILYLGWARKIFTQHHFPVKVTAQVGVGLGANYPHLFEVHVAGIASMFHHWSDLYGRLLSPAAALATLVLVYQTALHLTRSQLISVAAALAWRAIPNGIAYSIYASNYSLTMLFFAAFLYVGIVYIDTGRRPYLVFMTLLVAFGMYINYLMGILWVAWAAAIVLAHARAAVFDTDDPEGKRVQVFFEGHRANTWMLHSFHHTPRRPRLGELLRQRWFWSLLAAGIAIGSVWYVRNWIVTGNPVYAFFPGIFGGKNINMEVLKSAEIEWLRNGDGIERYALDIYGSDSLGAKLRGTWSYFVTHNQSWKWAPVWMALAVPGMLLALLLPLVRWAIRPRNVTERLFLRQVLSPTLLRGGALALVMAGLMLAYHYLISGIYLYQIISLLPVCGVFVTLVLHTAGLARMGGLLKKALIMLIVICGIVPGLSFALQGFKWTSTAVMGGRELYPLTLYHFRRPMMDSDVFYRLQYGDEVDMWNYINRTLPGRTILTHENRNLLYDESITFVHLDDWDMQQLYGMSDPAARAKFIRDRGIEHYLYLPMEDKSPINKRAGMDELRELGYLRKDYEMGGMILYYISTSPGRPGEFIETPEGWGEMPRESRSDDIPGATIRIEMPEGP